MENHTMRMKNLPHPSRIVQQECIEPLGLTVTGAARYLRVRRQALNNLVNERAGVSPEMDIRLSKTFGGSPEVWLGLQFDYELEQEAKTAGALKISRIEARESPLAA